MIALQDISKIGFGCYRTSINSQDHYKSLSLAIDLGCNLIDTSSTYLNGDSEKLIGKLIKDKVRDKLFIVTKAGYISQNNLELLKNLNNAGLAKEDVVDISSDFKHSIHPDFLASQIEQSLLRLGTKYLDGFLLHSPEYYFKQTIFEESEYYARIKKAFNYLENLVEKGVIRYYGISSNSFPLPYCETSTTKVDKLVSMANQVSSSNHFKFVQFPFNLLEQGVCNNFNDNAESALILAKKNNLLTFGNRPLNAKKDLKSIRLALYNEALEFNEERASELWQDCLSMIEAKLNEQGFNDELFEIEILKKITHLWKDNRQEKFINHLYGNTFYSFLNVLYNNNIPTKELKCFNQFEHCLRMNLKKWLTLDTVQYLNLNGMGHLICDSESLPRLACREYLQLGIDHVLLGMRNTKYVDSMKSLF